MKLLLFISRILFACLGIGIAADAFAMKKSPETVPAFIQNELRNLENEDWYKTLSDEEKKTLKEEVIKRCTTDVPSNRKERRKYQQEKVKKLITQAKEEALTKASDTLSEASDLLALKPVSITLEEEEDKEVDTIDTLLEKLKAEKWYTELPEKEQKRISGHLRDGYNTSSNITEVKKLRDNMHNAVLTDLATEYKSSLESLDEQIKEREEEITKLQEAIKDTSDSDEKKISELGTSLLTHTAEISEFKATRLEVHNKLDAINKELDILHAAFAREKFEEDHSKIESKSEHAAVDATEVEIPLKKTEMIDITRPSQSVESALSQLDSKSLERATQLPKEKKLFDDIQEIEEPILDTSDVAISVPESHPDDILKEKRKDLFDGIDELENKASPALSSQIVPKGILTDEQIKDKAAKLAAIETYLLMISADVFEKIVGEHPLTDKDKKSLEYTQKSIQIAVDDLRKIDKNAELPKGATVLLELDLSPSSKSADLPTVLEKESSKNEEEDLKEAQNNLNIMLTELDSLSKSILLTSTPPSDAGLSEDPKEKGEKVEAAEDCDVLGTKKEEYLKIVDELQSLNTRVEYLSKKIDNSEAITTDNIIERNTAKAAIKGLLASVHNLPVGSYDESEKDRAVIEKSKILIGNIPSPVAHRDTSTKDSSSARLSDAIIALHDATVAEGGKDKRDKLQREEDLAKPESSREEEEEEEKESDKAIDGSFGRDRDKDDDPGKGEEPGTLLVEEDHLEREQPSDVEPDKEPSDWRHALGMISESDEREEDYENLAAHTLENINEDDRVTRETLMELMKEKLFSEKALRFEIVLNDVVYTMSYTRNSRDIPSIEIINTATEYRTSVTVAIEPMTTNFSRKIIAEFLKQAQSFKEQYYEGKQSSSSELSFVKRMGMHVFRFNNPWLTVPVLGTYGIMNSNNRVQKAVSSTQRNIIAETLIAVTANSLMPDKKNGWLIGGAYYALRQLMQRYALPQENIHPDKQKAIKACAVWAVCFAGAYGAVAAIS